ncbi:gliding motility-associated C-terminal domain-containing protein [Rhodocytophaga rosea]|uniref:Gliding motility-associated C-terminal domain-containing protein n=1 Tax=Rhodocytophaga rosea TaxID=2704465 RepID=A0A6C0GIL4_9BACT|nr:gliding motility-associated C-terminal domain-containing protein [Rhodocytophaga rosea]QHT67838.1 gliding motility-associated C-terminal domain-containing protein [Rhodocytophaga rosea]
MKSIQLFCLLLLLAIPTWATHIVGGELSVQYANRDYRYTLSLNLYFDDINGESEAEDNEIFVAVFSKTTHQRINYFALSQSGSSQVAYTSASCVNGRLQTRQIRYSTEITLDPNIYTEAGGYYFTWERCCRNETIANSINPGNQGMVFYLEFPALSKDGRRFINSSPAFTMPKGDYICVNEPSIFEFGAADADGDALKYSLVAPLAGNSELRNPPFGIGPNPGEGKVFYPAPYKTLNWLAGYNLSNVMGGPVPLQVNATTGQLIFTTNRLGLYVFSVLCEEFRDGVKIGAVQRDFQLLVIDCPKNSAPVVQIKQENATALYQQGQIMTLSYSGQPCFEVLVSDPDFSATIQLQVNALNFPAAALTVSSTLGRITNPKDTLHSKVCFIECIPHSMQEPLLIEIIASDNGCPVPKRDTMVVQVYMEPIPSISPDVETTLPDNTVMVQNVQSINFNVTATDRDGDKIKLYAVGRGFSLAEMGMSFTNSSGVGTITQPFVWTPTCELMENKNTFAIDFITEDNSCSTDRFDTTTVYLTIESFEKVISQFMPPNVFTPNNDGANDYFQIPNLPSDNCQYVFQSIEVFNRWGKPVYSSHIRDFQWSGLGFPTGTYFYLINYGAIVYKGTVSLLR